MGIRLDIEDDMGKAQEIKLLEKIMGEFRKHTDNYLTQLFTRDFVQWASNQIQNDAYVDVMQYIMPEPDQEKIQLEKKCNVLQNTVNQWQEKFEETGNYYQKTIADLRNKVDDIFLSSENDCKIINELRIEIDKSELENVRLKAKLYDMMMEKGVPDDKDRS
jgi:hypothetical protein